MVTNRHVAEDVPIIGSILGKTDGTSKLGDSTHRFSELDIATGGFVDYVTALQFKKAGVNSVKIESDGRISGVINPSGGQDVATKDYVDSIVVSPYAQTVTVAKSGGDYTLISDALTAITDASTSKRYCILVYPGTYVDAITVKEYIDIIGATDKWDIIIAQADASVLTSSSISNWSIRNLTLSLTAPTDARNVIDLSGGSALINVMIRNCKIIFAGNYDSKAIYRGTNGCTDFIIDSCDIVGTSGSYGYGIQFGDASTVATVRSGIYNTRITSVKYGLYSYNSLTNLSDIAMLVKNCYISAGTSCFTDYINTDSKYNSIFSYNNTYITGDITLNSVAATRTITFYSYHDSMPSVSKNGAGTENFYGVGSTINGVLQTDQGLYIGQSVQTIDGAQIEIGSGTGFRGDATMNQMLFYVDPADGSQLVIGKYDYRNKDYDHATTADPTLFINSSSDPDTINTQWFSLSYSAANHRAEFQHGGEVATEFYFAGITHCNDVLKVDWGLYLKGDGAGYSTKLYVDQINDDMLHLIIGSSENGYSLVVGAQYYKNYDHAAQTNPTIFIHSATDPDSDNTQWISITHNQTNGVLQTGKGNLTIGNGSTSHSLITPNDVFITGKLEVDNLAFFDSAVYLQANTRVADDYALEFGGAPNNRILWAPSTETVGDAWKFTIDSTNKIVVFTDRANDAKSHDHAVQSNPTIFIHSATDPDTDNTQWISFAHNQTDGVIKTGKGNLTIGTGSDSHSLTTPNDVFVSGKLEVDSTAYFDSDIYGSSWWLVPSNPPTTYGMRIWADGDTLKIYQRGEDVDGLYQFNYNQLKIPSALYVGNAVSFCNLYFGNSTDEYIKVEPLNNKIKMGTGGSDRVVVTDDGVLFTGTKIGFFNTAIVVKTAVADQDAWVDINSGYNLIDLADMNTKVQAIRDKLQALIDSLQSYGLV